MENIIEKEFILCAAIKYNGFIVSAHRHSDCYTLLRDLIKVNDDDLPGRDSQGFLTSLNRFVDRREGWVIAKKNNQIQYGLEVSDFGDDSVLISENLY